MAVSAAADIDTAECPICNKPVPINTINSHIDLCLLPGGQSLAPLATQSPVATGTPTRNRIISTDKVAYTPSSSEKRRSPSSLSSRSTSDGKQLVLSFTKSSRWSANAADPPPNKTRRLDSTSFPSSYSHIHLQTSRKSGCETSQSLSSVPLAELMRPTTLEGYVGQEAVVGMDTPLARVLETGHVPSMIFWGPPGCGKTTLARIIAGVARDKCACRFVQLSATTSGINEIKDVVKVAKNEMKFRRKTILFIDEIHRFNKLQQDTFLPHVEDGTIVLLGATTENPSFQLNSALLSRCRVVVLEKLQTSDVVKVLTNAASQLGVCLVGREDELEKKPSEDGPLLIEEAAMNALAELCDGDARSALNGLHLAVQAKQAQQSINLQYMSHSPDFLTRYSVSSATTDHLDLNSNSEQLKCTTQNEENFAIAPSAAISTITVQDIKESLQKTHLLYDRAGEEHYNIISALHKSMRGSDENASLYWLARMLCAGEDPLYIARRVIRFASEDIGLADPNSLTQAIAAFQGCQFLGMPECEVLLAQAVIYMARAPKSIEVYSAYSQAKQSVLEHKGPLPPVPLHLRNAPTKLMSSLGYAQGYKYNPDFKGEEVEQDYLPKSLNGLKFFK